MVKTKCEVYSRVVGYIRPVSNWNDSKQAEFADRKHFDGAITKVIEEIEHDKQTSLTNEIVHDLLRARK